MSTRNRGRPRRAKDGPHVPASGAPATAAFGREQPAEHAPVPPSVPELPAPERDGPTGWDASSAGDREGPAGSAATIAPILAAESAQPAITVALSSPAAETVAATGAGVSHRRVVRSAAVIMLGNLLSSVLGMVRIETVNALFYGATSGAFLFALRPIQQLTDLLVGGSVNGALIPTFVDHSATDQREELRHIYSSVANLAAIVMVVGLVAVAVAAPYFVPLEAPRFSAASQRLTVQLVQIAAFSLLGLGLYFVGAALLYALRVVVYPAFATAIYHIGVIACGTLVLLYALNQAGLPLGAALHPGMGSAALNAAREVGARGLAAGAAVGAAGEFVLLLPGLRRVAMHWRPVLDLRHPAVRQILRLYAPIAVGLVISVAAQNLDASLLGRTPGGAEANVTALTSATTLIQFPIGLVASALAFSVLPPLAAAATAGDLANFKHTLNIGFRLGLVLMIPAWVGLLVLQVPIMSLLFEHGACSVSNGCTYRNVLALRTMSFQLPFVVVDQLLIAAYYARKNTLVPTLVGVASIFFYAAVAVPLAETIGMPAIAFGNALQNSSHAVMLFVLLTLTIGDLGLRALASGVARIGLAAAGMAAVCEGLLLLLPRLSPTLFSLHHLIGQLLTVVLVGGAGVGVYLALAAWLRLDEVHMIGDIVRSRLGRAR